jgi:hypothetical protein
MTNKIAVVFAAPWEGTDSEKNPNHYRYTVFDKRVGEDRTSTIILRYADMSIEQFLNKIKIELSYARGFHVSKAVNPGFEDKTYLEASCAVRVDEKFIATPIGRYEGYDCYLIYKESHTHPCPPKGIISVKEVPNYGNSSVGYAPETARSCIGVPNITNTMLGFGDIEEERRLFDAIDEEVADVLKPFIALLPETA